MSQPKYLFQFDLSACNEALQALKQNVTCRWMGQHGGGLRRVEAVASSCRRDQDNHSASERDSRDAPQGMGSMGINEEIGGRHDMDVVLMLGPEDLPSDPYQQMESRII